MTESLPDKMEITAPKNDEPDDLKPYLGPKKYDFLKLMVTIVLPALAVFYLSLSQIWGIPAGEKVVSTITAFDLFAGVIMQISSRNYKKSDAKYDGILHVGEDKDGLVLNDNVESLEKKKHLLFKVVAHPPEHRLPGND